MKEQVVKFIEFFSDIPLLHQPSETEGYASDWCQEFKGEAPVVIFPRTTAEVQKIVLYCNRENIKLVPSGGRTGLSGGASATSGEVILSLEKMARIIEINHPGRYVHCEAGAILQKVQDAAAEQNFFLPLDLPTKGTSQIGGNIATNAGGIRVVRWGNTRELVLGMTVVTGRGEILDLNRSLIKNNTGYDLKSLFIASEGTLGIITEATLKLTSKPQSTTRIFCGADSVDKVIESFILVRDKFPTLSAFEYLDNLSLTKVIEHKKLKNPLSGFYDGYMLIEIELNAESNLEAVENFIGELIEKELVLDAVCSSNEKQAAELMSIRESISETLSSNYSIHKNDISLPIQQIPGFISQLDSIIGKFYGSNLNEKPFAIFGHIGDGNLHVNFIKPSSMEKAEFYKTCKQVDREMFALLQSLKGSISAEHGVGLLKKPYLTYSRSETEINLMRQIKKIFDPNNILNPGKIFD